jgi:hypothetical protein
VLAVDQLLQVTFRDIALRVGLTSARWRGAGGCCYR